MKQALSLLIIFIFFGAATPAVQSQSAQPSQEYLEAYQGMQQRMEWWTHDRFGMFIHFGAYSHLEQEEWYKTNRKLGHVEYDSLIAGFKPEKTDCRQWARLAKMAGMKYAILTAKHHEGFCMFDTETTDYKITSRMPGRDIVKEFVEAFRAEGIKVGLYYSVIDWHHPDYPHFGDDYHPSREDTTYRGTVHHFDNYIKYMHEQVRELVTNYGDISIMWFDFSYGDMRDEKWKARELIAMVQEHQPGIIINNRLGLGDNKNWGITEYNYNMYYTPEQRVPEKPIVDKFGNPIPWELCLTTNNNWSYHRDDHQWKGPELIIHTLVKCVANGGNLLFNMGPDKNGLVPEPYWDIYRQIGEWMKANGESIYGCGPSGFGMQPWGYFTKKDRALYVHRMYPYIGYIQVRDYFDRVKKVTVLATGEEALVTDSWWGDHSGDKNKLYFNLKTPENHQIHFNYIMPDPFDTVFKIELK
ncbi:MAG TPA: alpha-L-fucosidase [Desulfobacterales bacterium]|nr:alpha-L-fucosidase [Desulfobacterales bacterium]